MPYNNEYNRMIASDLNGYNRRFSQLFAYSPVDGRGSAYSMEGGSSAGVLFQMGNASKREAEDNIVNDDLTLPPVYYYGNDSEGMKGGSGFAEGTYRDRGDGSQLGVSPAMGVYAKQGMGMSGGNLFSDIYDGFSDLGSDIGKAVEYINPFGSGKPDNNKARLLGRMLGKMMKHHHEMKGSGIPEMMDTIKKSGGAMCGGSWWDSLKSGISDVVGFLPELAIHALGASKPKARGRPKKVGGAILGNQDPYPVQGNSQRLAGKGKITKKEKEALMSVIDKHTEKRGRGRPKKVGGAEAGVKELVGMKQGDLLAMPSVVLSNGVPPTAQLRGSYGGAKPKKSKAEAMVMKAVEKKLKGGKNLSGMTDKSAEMKQGCGVSGGGDGRKKRAEIVKKIMKEKGLKMIEASKYVKEHKLY